jgi:hypothetical protein
VTANFNPRDLIDDMFRLTGQKLSPNDPLVIAAFFQWDVMRQASEAAASRIESASGVAHSAAQAASYAAEEAAGAASTFMAVCHKLEAEHTALILEHGQERTRREKEFATRTKVLADAFELRVKKAVRDACHAQSTGDGPPQGWRGVLAGIVFGAVAALGAVSVACNFSYSWVSDARFGAEWRRVIPTIPPALRDKLVEHFEKQRR